MTLPQLPKLLIGQIQVDHNGSPLKQCVLDKVDGFEVGMSTAQEFKDTLFGFEASCRADLLYRFRVNEDHVDCSRAFLPRAG